MGPAHRRLGRTAVRVSAFGFGAGVRSADQARSATAWAATDLRPAAWQTLGHRPGIFSSLPVESDPRRS